MTAARSARGAGPGTYAFGDTAVASRRLDVLASVFGPTSISLLRDLPSPSASVETVLDLGCGPGHTTAMLAAVFDQAVVTGIDASDAFVDEATRAASARCRYQVADVTGPSLPGAPADLIYARFLVVHLPEPHRAMAAWARQLAPGGFLVVEEPERIETGDADFRQYLELASVVVDARGGDLYAGRLLTAASPPVPAAQLVFARCTSLDVPAGRAATIFSLNLDTWRDDLAVTAVIRPGHLSALADRLEKRRSDTATGVIRWWMTQLVVRR